MAANDGGSTPAAERDAALQALITRGGEARCVDLSEVGDVIRRLGLDDEDGEDFLAELQSHGIDVRDDCGSETAASSHYANGDLALATVDAVGIFLNELRRFPLLTAAEEVDLAKRIERGDIATLVRVINSY